VLRCRRGNLSTHRNPILRPRPPYFPRVRPGAFTLVELLAVIGIIGLLVSILTPALGKAAQEVVCMSNLRQFGVGFQIYADQGKGWLAQDGPDGSDKGSNLIGGPNLPNGIADGSLWYNAIPSNIQKKSYYDLLSEDRAGGAPVPTSGTSSIFICPAADAPGTLSSKDRLSPDGGRFLLYGSDPAQPGTRVAPYGSFKFQLSYVFNSAIFTTTNDGTVCDRWKLSQLRPSTSCVLMVEKLARAGEFKLPDQAAAQPNMGPDGYTNNVGQPKANWKRFTTRHHGGGFLLFADGHVAWYGWGELQPTVNASNPGLIDGN
jgi:type II secretory pathway pseudopilin PulG